MIKLVELEKVLDLVQPLPDNLNVGLTIGIIRNKIVLLPAYALSQETLNDTLIRDDDNETENEPTQLLNSSWEIKSEEIKENFNDECKRRLDTYLTALKEHRQNVSEREILEKKLREVTESAQKSERLVNESREFFESEALFRR